MIRARFLIREINGSRLPSKVQCHAKSTVAYLIKCNETKDVNNEIQYARPTKDIPGPKALPLLGNWFRFLPHIGKSSLSLKYVEIFIIIGLFEFKFKYDILNQIRS